MNNLQTVYSISIAPVKQASDQLDDDATMLSYANGFIEMAKQKHKIFGDAKGRGQTQDMKDAWSQWLKNPVKADKSICLSNWLDSQFKNEQTELNKLQDKQAQANLIAWASKPIEERGKAKPNLRGMMQASTPAKTDAEKAEAKEARAEKQAAAKAEAVQEAKAELEKAGLVSLDDARIIKSDSPTLALMIRVFENATIENAIDAGKIVDLMTQSLAKEIDVKSTAIYQAIESKQIKNSKVA
jgi:hypothetical protein